MEDNETRIDLTKPPAGWSAVSTGIGVRYRLGYHFEATTHFVVDVTYFPSSREAKIDGPFKVSRKGRATPGTVPVEALAFAHTRTPVLLLWLAKAAKQ